MDLIILALNLSLLTYVIGGLILGLPIPYASIKRWGPRLIADAVAAAVIASSLAIILGIADTLLAALSVDWPSFYEWLSARTAELAAAFATLSYFSTVIKGGEYSFLSSPLSMAASYISTAFTSLKMIYMLSSVIYTFRERLAVMGVVLYAVPFRIGRGVGGFMIAASVVMYVGFPLMPSFVAAFEGATAPPPVSGASDTYILHVVDVGGDPVPYPIINLYAEEYSTEPVGVIVGDSNGDAVLGDGLDVLPQNFTLATKVGFMGYLFTPDPNEIRYDETEWILRLTSLIYSEGLAAAIPPEVSLRKAELAEGVIRLDIEVFAETSLPLITVASDTVEEVLLDGNNASCGWSTREWRGVELKECLLSLGPGGHEVVVKHSGAVYLRPEVGEKRVMYLESIFSVMTSVLTQAVSFLYTMVVLPGVYLASLIAVTAAASRILGGSRVRLI